MTLKELSPGYRESAQLLKTRIQQLRKQLKQTTDPEETWFLKRRISELMPMLKEMEALAELTSRYYEAGYYRTPEYSSNCFHGLKINFKNKGKQ